MIQIKKLSLIFILLMFTFTLPPAHAYTSSTMESPDCSKTVYVDNVFSDFFKNFIWHNRKVIPSALGDQILYWIIFQEELTQAYGYLENPPAEIILKNQLCNTLNKKSTKTVSIADADLIKWFSTYGKVIVDQVRQHSMDTRNSLISKQKDSQMSNKEQMAMQDHLRQIQTKVRKDYF